ncbi:MAG: hypothetical protein K0R09_2307 [Clostridiales bacterium]|nr:hypothetical protein [Clostridiales bacterium]
MNKHTNIYNLTMAFILIIFLFGMPVSYILVPDREFSESENRVLSKKPDLSLEEVSSGKFTANFEKYVSDQIPIRDLWIGIKSSSEKLIGKKDNNGVYLGSDGYLLQMFSKPDLRIINRNVDAINSFALANPEVNKYFMLVPNSLKVLEDKLPEYAFPENQLEYIEKVKKSVNSDINFIDIYDTLASKKNEYIYYKTDHHWTTLGAYYAYERLGNEMGFTSNSQDFYDIKRVTKDFYGTLYSKAGFRNIEPDSIELYIPKKEKEIKLWYYDNEKTGDSLYKMDNLNKKDKFTVFLDGNHSLIKINTSSESGKKLVVIKDSYANPLVPFLTDHYSEIYMVDLRFYYDDINELIKTNEIDDGLLLYNANTFFEDESISKISW